MCSFLVFKCDLFVGYEYDNRGGFGGFDPMQGFDGGMGGGFMGGEDKKGSDKKVSLILCLKDSVFTVVEGFKRPSVLDSRFCEAGSNLFSRRRYHQN